MVDGSQGEQLVRLTDAAIELDSLLGEYLSLYPSARVEHYRLASLIGALRRESDAVAVRTEKTEAKAERVAVNAADREERMAYTKFEIEMAAMRKVRGYEGGHTPAEYRALVAEASARMGAPQTQEELDEIMRNAL